MLGLGTDRIDLYYTHFDDESTPVEEIITALDALVREGKARHIAASNLCPARLAASPEFSVWSWAEVVDRLARNRLTDVSPEDIEAAQACRTVDMVLRAMHQVSAEEWNQIVAVTPAA